MQVSFEAPRTVPGCVYEYMFPNTTDVPISYSGDTLIARDAHEGEYYRILQKGLMDLAVLNFEYLIAMELNVPGRAIVYYRSQPLITKNEAKRFGLPGALFSFGAVIRTAYGECGVYLQPAKERSLSIWLNGMGIAQQLVQKVIMPHINAWSFPPKIEFNPQSKYREIVVRSSPAHRWYGYFGRGFNIPQEEYA